MPAAAAHPGQVRRAGSVAGTGHLGGGLPPPSHTPEGAPGLETRSEPGGAKLLPVSRKETGGGVGGI